MQSFTPGQIENKMEMESSKKAEKEANGLINISYVSFTWWMGSGVNWSLKNNDRGFKFKIYIVQWKRGVFE